MGELAAAFDRTTKFRRRVLCCCASVSCTATVSSSDLAVRPKTQHFAGSFISKVQLILLEVDRGISRCVVCEGEEGGGGITNDDGVL